MNSGDTPQKGTKKMKKLQSTIINATLMEIFDKERGEVRYMTKLIYTAPRQDTDKMSGPALLECYKVGNHLEKIKTFIMRPIELELEERPMKNGVKYVVTKIGTTTL